MLSQSAEIGLSFRLASLASMVGLSVRGLPITARPVRRLTRVPGLPEVEVTEVTLDGVRVIARIHAAPLLVNTSVILMPSEVPLLLAEPLVEEMDVADRAEGGLPRCDAVLVVSSPAHAPLQLRHVALLRRTNVVAALVLRPAPYTPPSLLVRIPLETGDVLPAVHEVDAFGARGGDDVAVLPPIPGGAVPRPEARPDGTAPTARRRLSEREAKEREVVVRE